MSKFITLIMALLCFDYAFSQASTTYPEIGKPCPDFYFNDVEYYSKKEISLKDFKGQWLILDCWNRHCGFCIDGMPATDSLQKKFTKQVKIILVGYIGTQYAHHEENKPIRALYKELRSRLNIDLPIAFDSLLFHRFYIGACPYIIIVDPKGIVRGITMRLKERDFQDFLSGQVPLLERVANRKGV